MIFYIKKHYYNVKLLKLIEIVILLYNNYYNNITLHFPIRYLIVFFK